MPGTIDFEPDQAAPANDAATAVIDFQPDLVAAAVPTANLAGDTPASTVIDFQPDEQRAVIPPSQSREATRTIVSKEVQQFVTKPLVPPEYTPPYLLGEAAGAVLPSSTATKIYTGELKAVGDLISSFSSPMNVALLGAGGLGKVAQRLIGGAFSAQAAARAPEAWKQFNQTADPELKTRIAIGTVAGIGLPLLAMRGHGPEKTAQVVNEAVDNTLAEQAKEPVETVSDGSIDFQPDTVAPVEAGSPPVEATGAVALQPEAIATPGGETPNAEAIYSDAGQVRQGSETGQPEIQSSPGQSSPNLQFTPSEEPGGSGQVTTEPSIAQSSARQPPEIPFRDDPGLPFMTKLAMEDALLRAGYDETEIAQMPAAKVTEAVSRKPAILTALPEEAGVAPAGEVDKLAALVKADIERRKVARSAPSLFEAGQLPFNLRGEQATSEIGAEGQARASAEATARQRKQQMTLFEQQREYEAELLREAEQHMARGGDELLDVLKQHGLPLAGSKFEGPYAGELNSVREAFRSQKGFARLVSGEPVRYSDIFRRFANGGLDSLTTLLQQKGFDVANISDTLNLIDERLNRGQRIYGNEARAQTLEEASYGGPGAAAATEKLASYELRKFGERFQADQRIAQEIRDNTGNRYYEPIPNSITADEAVKLVDQRPLSQVINAVRDDQSGLPFHVRSTMGQIAIQRLNKAYETLTKAGATKDAETVLNQAVDLAEWQQEFGTRLGQGVQSFAMWQRLGPEGKLAGISRNVQKARDTYTAAHTEELQQIIRVLKQQQMTDAERLAALKKLFSTNKTARKIKPNTQKLIDAARTGKFTDQIFYDIASERLGLPKYNQQIAAEIMRKAFTIAKASDGLPKDQATLDLYKFIATQMGFRPSDLPIGIYYGNMLSGYNTQLVNTVDTFFNVISELNGLAMVNPRAAMKIYGNAIKGFAEGRADFLLALTKGRMLSDSKWMEVPRLMEVAKFGEKGGVPIKTDTRSGKILKAIAETRLAKIVNAWKYVGRLMSASDSVMFRGAKEGRSALLADRLAREEGLRGATLDRRVRELLGRTPEQTMAIQQQAAAEGLRGASGIARLSELREQMRGLEANADANDFAGVATYNHDPQGVLGYFSDKVGRAANRYQLLKLVVPFTRIVANVTNRGLNYTPWGFKRAMYGYSGDVGLPKGDARAAMLARATMGTVGLTTLMGLQATGALEINGAGPTDPERRRQLEQAGWKPYSLRIGDKYWSYIYTPVGLALSIAGNIADSYRYKEMDQKNAMMRGAYALSRIGSTIFSQSFLSGLSNLFGALSSGPGESISNLRRMVQSTAGTATTPRIVLDVQRLFDPTRYDSTTLQGDLLKNTPFAALANKPTLNAFGEPVQMPTNRFVSNITKDPAWRLVTERGLRVPVPDKYTDMPDGRGGKRQITPDEYYDYLAKTGPKIKQYVMLQGVLFDQLNPDEAQKRLTEKAQEIREPILRRMRLRARYNPVD